MEKQRILVIEDDRELNMGIVYGLEKEGYELFSAETLNQGERLHKKERADLILLDVNLPDGEGFELCRKIKGTKDTPVLFITARDLEEDVLKGYELGAEDYIIKPFSIQVLIKKIEVVLKRSEPNPIRIFNDGYLKIDFSAAQITVSGQECVVTPTEFRLLCLFTEHAGQLLTYSSLLDWLWQFGCQSVDKHALAVYVNRLRGKIETEEHRYISNIYGMGYQWLR